MAVPAAQGEVPGGIYLAGMVAGSSTALFALAIVLVYKTDRIINFAQATFGAVAGTFLVLLVRYQPGYAWLRTSVCSDCLARTGPGTVAYLVNFLVTAVLAVGLGCFLAWLVYFSVVRRFADAPRLLVTVSTVFVGAIMAGIQTYLPNLLTSSAQRRRGLDLDSAVRGPVEFTLRWRPVLFHFGDVATLVVTALVLAALYAYLRYAPTGVAIRAASENASRAETLGVNVTAINSRVWLIAGGLSAVAAVLASMRVGPGSAGLSTATLVRVLTAAVVARMTSLPVATAAAVLLGVLDQVCLWLFNSSAPLDGALLLLVGVLLLVQRHLLSRAEADQASSWRAARLIQPIPLVLRSLPEVRRWVRAVPAILAVVLLGLPWVMSPGQTSLGTVMLIHALIALSLLPLTGWAGQISLGQVGFAGVGAFVAAAVPAPFPIAVLAGSLSGAVVAVAIGIPALKLRGLHLAIMTLAFALAVSSLLVNPSYLGHYLPGSLARPTLVGMGLDDERVYFYLTLAVLAAVAGGVMGMQRSRTGRVLIAARDNELAAQSFGVSLTTSRLEAFAVAGAISALGGALLAFQQYGVKPTSFLPEESISIFLTAVIGGLGSVAGPILGAVYYGLGDIFSGFPLVAVLLSATGGLALVLLFPGGLAQLVFGSRDMFLRRIATRYRIVVPTLIADGEEQQAQPRAKILPKVHSRSGGVVFVPNTYTLPEHWNDRTAFVHLGERAPELTAGQS